MYRLSHALNNVDMVPGSVENLYVETTTPSEMYVIGHIRGSKRIPQLDNINQLIDPFEHFLQTLGAMSLATNTCSNNYQWKFC